MSLTQRIVIALAVFVVDLAVFFLPLTAIVAAVIIIWRPPWAYEFVASLYSKEGT